MTTGDLIVIYWYDTVQDASWEPVPVIEKEKPVLVKSVGWLLSKNEDCIRILTSVSGTSDSKMEAGSIIIPQKTVLRIEEIREDELDVE